MVFNTHKGQYQFNRFPCGVASAWVLFQKVKNIVLQGILVEVYLEILVTEANDTEHLQTLEQVLAHLQEYDNIITLWRNLLNIWAMLLMLRNPSSQSNIEAF